MKITDTLGRTLDIDVVVKSTLLDVWMEPLGYKLFDSKTSFLRVPEGPFALRVMSKLGAEVLVHLNGKLLIATTIGKGVQYLESDQSGQLFYLGQRSQAEANSESSVGSDLLSAAALTPTVATTGDEEENDAEVTAPLTAPGGAGLLFIVARFLDDPYYGSQQPPRQEYEFTFQLRAPQDHDSNLAASLSKLVEPPLPSEPDALTETQSHQPRFVCTSTGCGVNHSH